MDELDFIIERKILHIGNHLISARNRDLKAFGLTSSQSEALLFIERNQGTSIVALKDHLDVSHQAVQKTVAKLRERGLVTVSVSAEDARARSVSLSAEGERLCADLKRAGGRIGSSVLGPLDAQERSTLYRLLSKMEIDR